MTPLRTARLLAVLFFSIAFVGFAPAPALAWGDVGHRIVARLAERRLTPKARAAVRALLDGQSLSDVANWADEIVPTRKETGPWHYINLPLGARGFDASVCPDGACVVVAAEHFAAVLADSSRPKEERAEALKFVVHFVGDLHQPLHSGDDHDRGGNLVDVTWYGQPANLHGVWDFKIVERTGLSESAYVAAEEKLIASDDRIASSGSDRVLDWVLDANRLARDVVYKNLPTDHALGDDYYRAARPVVDGQIARAGVRLAALLNEALGGKLRPPSVTMAPTVWDRKPTAKGPAAAAPEPIRIGAFGAISGGQAWFGTAERRGIELAVDEINGSGGLLGGRKKELGGTVTGVVDYSQGGTDFRKQFATVKRQHPDAIFVPGYYQEAGVIIRQARDLGVGVPILGGDGWDADQLFSLGNTRLKDCYYSTHYALDDPSPAVQFFVESFKSKFGVAPDANVALAYDATRMLADAITRAGTTDGVKLREALAETRGFGGVTGTISIDARRNAIKPVVVMECKVEGGTAKPVYKTSVEP